HIAGLQVFFQALANHNPLVRLFDLPVDHVHQSIEAEGITHLSATPTFYNMLCSAGQIHPHVRSVTSGGEVSHRRLRERMASTFPNARIHNIYASTEAGTLLISSGDQFHVPKAYEGRIKVIEGVLAVHRSLLAASLQEHTSDEFYRTGDCVEVLDSRPLTIRFVSRHGDWINVGGYKVNPHEVEQALLAMEEVQEVLVYGRDNSVTGSLVCCDIVLVGVETLTAKDVHARLATHMPGYMIPRIVRCVDAIQSTHTGKKGRRP
ncbi:MAG: AMP-binding protein, partial [Aureliella sp.]